MPARLPTLVMIAALCSCLVLAATATSTVRLFIGYCPTDFSGAGAIVDVDPLTGAWTITHPKVHLPSSEVFGCVADYDPTFDTPQNNPDRLWFDFVSDDGAFLDVNMAEGNVTALMSSDDFFTGFIDFKVFPEDNNQLHGIAGTVTESGYCSNGCLAYGIQNTTTSRYRQVALIPFKAGADDTSFVDWTAQTMAFQGSYDLRTNTCGPESSSQCLITISTVDGSLQSAVYTPNYQVFKFAKQYYNPADSVSGSSSSHKVLAFTAGNQCPGEQGVQQRTATSASKEMKTKKSRKTSKKTNNAWTYQFLSLDMATANSTVVSCVDSSFVLDEDEWVGAFSPEQHMFATGSGNGNGDDPQLAVFNVSTGAVLINTHLTGLAKALKASMGLVFIWGVQFV